jgi:lysozyme
MKMTDEGLRLIMKFEGFRAKAYRDPVGIWTIGYGHTSRAGEPHVHAGLTITRAQAREILRKDVKMFADGVRRLVKVDLSDAQFSALVSFAYNVGLGGLARSSVLRAVNRREFNAVPRRLALWVKAGGRRLPGLVRRRAAEGAMFLAGSTSSTNSTMPADKVAASCPEPVEGKPLRESTTGWAAVLSAIAGLCSALGAVFRDLAQQAGGQVALAIAVLVILLATGWILRERYLKSQMDGV